MEIGLFRGVWGFVRGKAYGNQNQKDEIKDVYRRSHPWIQAVIAKLVEHPVQKVRSVIFSGLLMGLKNSKIIFYQLQTYLNAT
jgi:hypothetical protein